METFIERLSLNAWPALETIDHEGWLMRFAGGYTKRANSVTPLEHLDDALARKIDYGETVYRARQQAPIFRLPSCVQPAALDRELRARGYAKLDPTQVMSLALEKSTHRCESLQLSSSTAQWLECYDEIHPLSIDERTLHEAILIRIRGQRCLASVTQDENIVACGLGVLESNALGLFDLITHPDHRRQGHGTKLLQGLLGWGSARGANLAYLQVTQANTSAAALYRRAGFVPIYSYWYRAADL